MRRWHCHRWESVWRRAAPGSMHAGMGVDAGVWWDASAPVFWGPPAISPSLSFLSRTYISVESRHAGVYTVERLSPPLWQQVCSSSPVQIYVPLCPLLSPRQIASDWSHHLPHLLFMLPFTSWWRKGKKKSGKETLPVCWVLLFVSSARETTPPPLLSQLGSCFFVLFFRPPSHPASKRVLADLHNLIDL